MRTSGLSCVVALCTALLALADCNGAGVSPAGNGSAMNVRSNSASSPSPIAHVVLVVQENRTFNDFFATFPGGDGTTTGMTVANSNCSPPISGGSIALTKSPLLVRKDMNHSWKTGYTVAYDKGKLDAFDNVRFDGGAGTPECYAPYQYTDPSQIQPYWTMAQQYTLLEHMFATQGSDSFTAHQDIIRGGTEVETNKGMIDLPGCSGSKCIWGCDAPPKTRTHLITNTNKWVSKLGPFPCSDKFSLSYPTLRDLLDAKSISWKYYVPPQSSAFGKLMNAFDLVYNVRYGSEWGTNVTWPETNIFNDITGGTLPAVSWVIPEENSSDHPGTSQDNGPSWVASVVNAIGESGVLELDGYHCRLGRLGRLLRQPRARNRELRRLRLAGAGDPDFALRSPCVHLDDAIRVWKHSEVHRKQLESWLAWYERSARDEHHRLVQLFADTDSVPTDPVEPRQVVLPS